MKNYFCPGALYFYSFNRVHHFYFRISKYLNLRYAKNMKFEELMIRTYEVNYGNLHKVDPFVLLMNDI